MVRQPQHAAQFRLEALAEAALEPLSELLADKSYFLSEKSMTSLDCLALGYLSLALLPKMPQSWLADKMKKKYPNLCTFVSRCTNSCFQGPVTLKDARLAHDSKVVGESGHRSLLPWIPPPASTVLSTSQFLFAQTLSSLPFISCFRQDEMFQSSKIDNHTSSTFNSLPLTFVGGAAAAATVGSCLFYSARFLPSYSEGKREHRDMGEVGEMLAGIDFGPVTGVK